jgi:hypothetical protein
MKKYLITISTALLLSFPLISNAKYFTNYLSEGVEITRVHNHSNGSVTLIISGDVDNLDQCAVTTRHLKGDLDGHKQMVASVMLAFAAGKKIGLHASGCEIIPFWGASGGLTPVINNLWLLK